MPNRNEKTLLAIGALIWVAACSQAAIGQVNVLTYHNDNPRSGQNIAETILSPGRVTASRFGKLLTVAMDGKVDAQSLFVSGLSMPGRGTHNVVFAASEHDSVYAFDANSGSIFWHVSLLKAGETTSDNRGCDQVTPEIGITATPVVDLTAGPHGTIYLVAMSKDSNGNYYQRLHALDLTTGAEEFGGPQAIKATYPGTGANSSNGKVIFDPKQYKDRAGLLLLNGVVYTSWGSHCDYNPYTGWLIGYDRLTLAQTSVFNFAPNGSEAALWNSGGGPAADSQGNIFVSVANGTFDTSLNSQGFPSRGDFGNAFVKLSLQSGKLVPLDYWTMDNTNSESGSDTDLGSGGIMLLPDQVDASGKTRHLAVGAGKDSNLYVVDRDNMGKFDSTSDATIYQQLTGALPGGVWANPAYFGNYVYFGSVNSTVQAFQFSSARLSAASATTHSFTYPGVTPSISASGSSNPILWAVENTSPAVLHAYDATNLSIEYYNSNQASSGRDQFGPGNKYITPTIANGQVFVGTTNSVAVFGLVPKLPLANGAYTVTSQMSTLLLDDPGFSPTSGTQIIQWTPNGGANQTWVFTANGSGYYTIRNASSGLYLTDPGGSATLGTKLEQQSANGSDSQLWSLSISGTGYVIHNKASGLVVDDTGWSLQRGTGMELWSPTGNSNQ
ncbi:MAG: RICIN domain-containing protein, partial [Acidobacteriota bacterium]|nr:RICIN domain-containing protein [Acidobacteriota bacterium]